MRTSTFLARSILLLAESFPGRCTAAPAETVASGAKGPGVVGCDATAAYWAGGGQITRSSLLR